MPHHSTSHSSSDAERESIDRVLGRTPSGLFILAAGDGRGRETGMLASWVQQASFEPFMISVAVNRKRYINDWLAHAPRMALSLIGEAQTKFLKHFGKGFEPDDRAFEGVLIARGTTGLPVLSEALGYLEGEVAERCEAGDHIVYLVKITGAGIGDELASQKPFVHIRNNASNY